MTGPRPTGSFDDRITADRRTAPAEPPATTPPPSTTSPHRRTAAAVHPDRPGRTAPTGPVIRHLPAHPGRARATEPTPDHRPAATTAAPSTKDNRAARIDDTLSRITAAHAGLTLPPRDTESDAPAEPLEQHPPRRRSTPLRLLAGAVAITVFAATAFGWAAQAWLDSAITRVGALDPTADLIVDAAAQHGDRNVLIVATGSGAGGPTDTITLAHLPDGGGPLTVLGFPSNLRGRPTAVRALGSGHPQLRRADRAGRRPDPAEFGVRARRPAVRHPGGAAAQRHRGHRLPRGRRRPARRGHRRPRRGCATCGSPRDGRQAVDHAAGRRPGDRPRAASNVSSNCWPGCSDGPSAARPCSTRRSCSGCARPSVRPCWPTGSTSTSCWR